MRETSVPVGVVVSRDAQSGLPRQASRGGARLRAIIWLLLLGSGVYVAYKVLPIYIANYQLQDRMQTEARFATVNHRSNDEIRDIIYREIQDRDIPARREDIHIESSQRGVNIRVDYTVTVDLRVYQWTLEFHPTASNRAL